MFIDEKMLLARELAGTVQHFKRLVLNKENYQDLRQSEFILLATINSLSNSECRGVKASDLSNEMGITPSAVTHLINSLEETGYIERLTEPSDRRIVLVKLTVTGKCLSEKKEEKILQSFMGLVEFMGEKDSKELRRLLTSMYTYFTQRKK